MWRCLHKYIFEGYKYMPLSKSQCMQLFVITNPVGFVHKSLFAICEVYRHVEKEIETLVYPFLTFSPRVVWIVRTESD